MNYACVVDLTGNALCLAEVKRAVLQIVLHSTNHAQGTDILKMLSCNAHTFPHLLIHSSPGSVASVAIAQIELARAWAATVERRNAGSQQRQSQRMKNSGIQRPLITSVATTAFNKPTFPPFVSHLGRGTLPHPPGSRHQVPHQDRPRVQPERR